MGRCAVVGIGRTTFNRASGRTALAMAAEACRSALADCGLTAADVDGAATFETTDTSDPLSVSHSIGIDELGWDCSALGGGRSVATLIATAAAAIEAGLCNVVLIYRSLNGRSGQRYGVADESTLSGDSQVAAGGESRYDAPHGYALPPQWMAMWARRHQYEYGSTCEDLGQIAVLQRAHAVDNPHAIARSPLSLDQYLEGRWINEPLRVYDCAFEVDGAVALVLVGSDRAKSMQQQPVWLAGSAMSASRGLWDEWGDPTSMYADTAGPRLWERTGLTPADIDVACMYDCFTYTVMATMEGYGFCEKGEVGSYFAKGRATYGGDVVVNPHGGLLSEGYLHGLSHHYEAILQLRGGAGSRQVENAELALVTAGMGCHGGANVYSAVEP